MNEYVKKVLEENKRTKDPYLDLGNCGLTELPDELWTLQHVQRLNLGDYYFDEDGKFNGSANSENKNEIRKISNKIDKLVNLTTLILSNNQLKDYSFLQGLPKLTSLGLSTTRIKDYSFLQDLTNLTTLDLTFNSIKNYSFLQGLTNLTTLYLWSNEIRDISFLQNFPKLTSLDLSDNGLQDISSLQGLINLTTLNLSDNRLQEISPLQNLTNLTTLELAVNELQDISSLRHLTKLTKLDIGSNQLTDISPLQDLTNLTDLYLGENQLRDINSIQYLTKLTKLDLSSNELRDISPIKDLTNLIQLESSSNELSDISPIQGLTNLTALSLDNNKIQDITALQKLTSLAQLNLKGNLIEDIQPVLPLLRFDLLKVGLDENSFESSLNLYGNSIVIPPIEIVEQGNEAVIRYFEDIEEQGIDYIYEAKLLIVGEGESGKTTLAWKLKDINAGMPKKGDDRTKGIDIKSHEIDNIVNSNIPFRMNVWDFGGQEIYHATHQFFLTKRSLYVLVNNTRSNLTDFNHWLQMISLFSDSSPVIIVQNEVAGSPTDLDLRGLQQHFTNILYVRDTDLSNTEDGRLEKLIRDLHFQIQQLTHVGEEVPKQWVIIREEIKNIALEEPIISDREFYQVCRRNKIEDKDSIKRLGGFLHDLGVFLHFQDDPILRRTVILQNSWATKGVYQILDHPDIKAQKGHFSKLDAEKIWANTVFEDMHEELLQLMKKFELCYEVPNQSEIHYISPQLLPKQKPTYVWELENNLIINYEYDFMPKGLIGRLMVRLNSFIKNIDRFSWQSGCIFALDETDAQVIETYGTRKIEVRITGSFKIRLSSIIIKEIDELNGSFENLKVRKLIPCNCKNCIKLKTPHFYDYTNLMNRKKKGKRTVECDISFEDVPVQEILDGVYKSDQNKDITLTTIIATGNLEKALQHFERSHPSEAAVLNQQYTEGKRHFLLSVIDVEAWSKLQSKINNSILELSQMPAKSYGQEVALEHTIYSELKDIKEHLSSQDQTLNKILELSDQQDEILNTLKELEENIPSIDYQEQVLDAIERGMNDFVEKVPQATDIIETWKEAQDLIELEVDSKVKLKFALPFIFFKIEKEFAWDGKDWFKAIREDIQKGREGNWKEMFVE